MDKCKKEIKPDLKEIRKDHFAACLLTEEEKKQKKREIDEKEVKKAPLRKAYKENCLEVSNIKKYFPIYKGIMRKKVGEVKAIEDITFFLKKGETLGIVGESGCGKTTLARCLMRVYEPESGTILFKGREITHLKDRELKK